MTIFQKNFTRKKLKLENIKHFYNYLSRVLKCILLTKSNLSNLYYIIKHFFYYLTTIMT